MILSILDSITSKLKETHSRGLCLLSNLLVVNSVETIQKILDTGVVTQALVLIGEGSDDNRIDASYCLYNLTEKGTTEQIYPLINAQLVDFLMYNLSSNWSTELKKVTLMCLDNLIYRTQPFVGKTSCSVSMHPIVTEIVQRHNLAVFDELLATCNQELFENTKQLLDVYIEPALQGSELVQLS